MKKFVGVLLILISSSSIRLNAVTGINENEVLEIILDNECRNERDKPRNESYPEISIFKVDDKVYLNFGKSEGQCIIYLYGADDSVEIEYFDSDVLTCELFEFTQRRIVKIEVYTELGNIYQGWFK